MSYIPLDDTGRCVILRKAVRCEWCGERIKCGEKAIHRVYKFDGDFVSSRQHPECYHAMKKLSPADLSDGFLWGAMIRGSIAEK